MNNKGLKANIAIGSFLIYIKICSIFKRCKIQSRDHYYFRKKLTLNFSTSDTENAVIFYNAFNSQIHKKIPMNKNSMILTNISLIPEKKISEENIIVKFISPLVVHYRNQETRKDHFYSFEEEKFLEILKMNIKNQLQDSNELIALLEDFTISPINARKIIVKFYEKKVETNSGIFQLHADKQLLKYLYQSGIGSKRSSRIWNV